MKHAGAVSFALFLGSMTLLAQSFGQRNTQRTILHSAQISTNCPVDMQAWRQSGLVKQQRAKMSPGAIQKLPEPTLNFRLALANPTFTEIVGVRITVNGFNSKDRLSPTQMAAAGSSEIYKTLDLKLNVEPKSQTSTDLQLHTFTSVQSISLNSVSYADGSSWHASADRTCHIVPSGFVLIGGQ